MKDIIFSTATELARAIRKKQVSALEVLEAHLAQIAKYNSSENRAERLAGRRADRWAPVE